MSNNSIIPAADEIKAIEILATKAVESKFFEKLGGQAGIFSIAMYAKEMGLPIMTSLFGGMNNVMGKISIAPQLMNAMIRKAGHKLKIDSNDQKCTIEGYRKDTGETCSVTFSVEDAKRAGIFKAGGGWDKYPSDMCFARALSRLARRLFPDVIGIAYVEGEVEDDKDAQKDFKPTIDVGSPSSPSSGTEDALDDEVFFQFMDKFKSIEVSEAKLLDFASFTADKSNKSLQETMKQAMKNHERFERAYAKWAEDQKSTLKIEEKVQELKEDIS